MKKYRRHYCNRQHRLYRRMAKCVWRYNVAWIHGEGPYACIAHCNQKTITLHPTASAAEADQANDCRIGCIGHHDLVQLVLPEGG